MPTILGTVLGGSDHETPVRREGMKEDYDDYPYADENYEDEIFGYECMSCGHMQAGSGFGMTCDRCCGPVTECYE